MASRRVSFVVALPILLTAFGVGVAASLWQDQEEQVSAPPPVEQPPVKVARAETGVRVDASAPASGTPEPPCVASLPPAEPEATVVPPDLPAPAPTATREQEKVTMIEPELIVPPPSASFHPASLPDELKARPPHVAARRYVPRRIIRRRPGVQKVEVPILGPLFGMKF